MSAEEVPKDLAAFEAALSRIERNGIAALSGAADLAALTEAQFHFLGRKGELSALLRHLPALPGADRPTAGASGNRVKAAIDAELAACQARLASSATGTSHAVDVSLPGVRPRTGAVHPITRMTEILLDALGALGFGVADGPEIETAAYNFDRLNTPAGHPARSIADTLYLSGASAGEGADRRLLLRTHTSPVQIRTMVERGGKPPIRVAVPGRVYRRDAVDATHTPVFHQVEGLCVDEGISMAHLKGTMAAFARTLFGPAAKVRFRPSFFPFTEPSAEFDVSCVFCAQKGCGVCKQEGWIETGGAGLVHPNVLRGCGVDADRYSGFAFGMGVERLAQLRWGVAEIRAYYENDARFLSSFPGPA